MDTDRSNNNSGAVLLVVTTLVTFMVPFMTSAVNIALPVIGNEFSMNAVVLGWVATAFFLASSSLLVPLGRVADIYGRRKVFTTGAVVYGLASILGVTSRSQWFFVAARTLQGVGAAMILSTGIAIVTSAYPPRQRGRVLGINAAGTFVGLSAGPLLGGFLTAHAGWRSIFVVGLVIPLVAVPLLLWKLKTEWVGAKGEHVDYTGSAIFTGSLISLIYGLTSLPGPLAVVLLVAGIAGFVLFAWWENRTESPVLQLALFRNNRAFIFSNVSTLVSYASTYAVTFLLSLYLQYNRGLSPEAAGLVLVSAPTVQSLSSLVSGRLSDRIEPRILASAGMAFCTLALVLLSFVGNDNSMPYLLLALVVLGLGIGMVVSPNTTAIMASASKGWYGVASAAMATSRQVGTMLSMGFTMLMLAVFVGHVQITPQHFGDFLVAARYAFLVFSALCFMGIFASLARGNVLVAREKEAE